MLLGGYRILLGEKQTQIFQLRRLLRYENRAEVKTTTSKEHKNSKNWMVAYN
jgi:hypothetical protein